MLKRGLFIRGKVEKTRRCKEAWAHRCIDKVESGNSFHFSYLTTHRFASSAMTLAEVLITLGIIGVVAALSIPNMINNIGLEQNRTQLKKEYSALTNAVNILQAQNGSIDTSSADNLIADLGTQLSIIKKGSWDSLTTLPATFYYRCYKESSGTCGNIMYRPGSDGARSFVTSDGAIFLIRSFNSTCTDGNYHVNLDNSPNPQLNSCAQIFVDVNGDKNPNQLGVDLHHIYLLKKDNVYYVKPSGANIDTYCTKGFPENYNLSLHCTNRMLLNMDMP